MYQQKINAVTGGKMSGGRALAEMLRLANVGPMFGMGGFQLLPFYDAVRQLGLRHYLINDERTGVFAADAYARVSGRPGVCDGTLGPGATNLVTGLVESLNAGVPLIAIVGDTHRAHSGKNMTQEGRQIDILRPACKELIRVESVARIPEAVRRAFAVATAGRPGPVVIDIAEDITHGEHEFEADDFYLDPHTLSIPARLARPAAADVAKACDILRAAKRPMLLVGGGVHLSNCYGPLLRLAEALDIPVAHTTSGKGSIPCTHRLSLGVFGRYSRIANDLMDSTDCLVVAGCKLGEIATKRYTLIPKDAPIIHLECVPEEFGHTTPATVALWCDAGEGLSALADALEGEGAALREIRRPFMDEIAERMAKWRVEAEPRYTSAESPINMGRLLAALNETMPDNGILVADGGFAAHWGGLLYDTKAAGRRFVCDRGFAAIGYGLPGALGAQLAAPDAPVVALTGDGGFNMTLGDLETARRAGANMIMVVLNNAASGYVRALQHAVYGPNYQSSELIEMDYAAIATAMGCRGVRIDNPDDLVPTFTRVLAERSGPTVIDVVVTRDPAKMLPAADSRTLVVKAGDRPV